MKKYSSAEQQETITQGCKLIELGRRMERFGQESLEYIEKNETVNTRNAEKVSYEIDAYVDKIIVPELNECRSNDWAAQNNAKEILCCGIIGGFILFVLMGGIDSMVGFITLSIYVFSRAVKDWYASLQEVNKRSQENNNEF